MYIFSLYECLNLAIIKAEVVLCTLRALLIEVGVDYSLQIARTECNPLKEVTTTKRNSLSVWPQGLISSFTVSVELSFSSKYLASLNFARHLSSPSIPSLRHVQIRSRVSTANRITSYLLDRVGCIYSQFPALVHLWNFNQITLLSLCGLTFLKLSHSDFMNYN